MTVNHGHHGKLKAGMTALFTFFYLLARQVEQYLLIISANQ